MISSGVHTVSNTQRGSSHFHILDPYKYCRELDIVIRTTKAHGYYLPTDYQLRIVNTLINELKSNVIYQSYDLFYFFGYSHESSYHQSTLDSQRVRNNTSLVTDFSLLNFINPFLFKALPVNPAINLPKIMHCRNGWKTGFNNTGMAGNSTGYLNTGWIAKDHKVNWAQNNAGGFGYWANWDDAGANSSYLGGASDTTNSRTFWRFQPATSSNTASGIINAATSNTTYVASGVTTCYGFHRLERTASNLSTYYKNGSSFGTSTQVSSSIIGDKPLYLNKSNNNNTTTNGPSSNPIIAFGLGAALGDRLARVEYDLFKNAARSLALNI